MHQRKTPDGIGMLQFLKHPLMFVVIHLYLEVILNHTFFNPTLLKTKKRTPCRTMRRPMQRVKLTTLPHYRQQAALDRCTPI